MDTFLNNNIVKLPPRDWCRDHLSDNYVVFLALPSNKDELNVQDFSYKQFCLLWHHDEFFRDCNGLYLSTNRPSFWHNAESCFRLGMVTQEPENLIKMKLVNAHKNLYKFAKIVFTFQGIFAFQHLKASLKCCKIVLALFCLIPSGIISRISCITEARSSKSKWDSTLCLVTVLATPVIFWKEGNVVLEINHSKTIF